MAEPVYVAGTRRAYSFEGAAAAGNAALAPKLVVTYSVDPAMTGSCMLTSFTNTYDVGGDTISYDDAEWLESASGTGTSTGVAAAVSATIPAPDLSTEGLTVNGKAVDLTGAKSLQDVSDAINAKGIDGVSAAVSADGKGINFYSNSALTLTDTGGNIVGANAKDVNANATYTLGTAAATGGSLAGGSVGTVDGANDLISRIDVALSSVADFAAQLGAVQNRFQSTISTLSSQSTNLKASQSTIQDADFAAETANLSKAQVLQQAGISVLAQANSQPQQILKLLQ